MVAPHAPRYGYGLRVTERAGRRVAWHEGLLPGSFATAHRALERDVVAVVMTERIAHGYQRTFCNRVTDQLLALGCGVPPPDPPLGPRPFTAGELVALPGRYTLDGARAFPIVRAGDGLRARADGAWLLQ